MVILKAFPELQLILRDDNFHCNFTLTFFTLIINIFTVLFLQYKV